MNEQLSDHPADGAREREYDPAAESILAVVVTVALAVGLLFCPMSIGVSRFLILVLLCGLLLLTPRTRHWGWSGLAALGVMLLIAVPVAIVASHGLDGGN